MLQSATSWQFYNAAPTAIYLQTAQFTLAPVDNSANQYTGTWANGGPTVANWNSGPSTCINNASPCVANAAATAFTNANFGSGVTLWRAPARSPPVA